jgi:hypothetical protein
LDPGNHVLKVGNTIIKVGRPHLFNVFLIDQCKSVIFILFLIGRGAL